MRIDANANRNPTNSLWISPYRECHRYREAPARGSPSASCDRHRRRPRRRRNRWVPVGGRALRARPWASTTSRTGTTTPPSAASPTDPSGQETNTHLYATGDFGTACLATFFGVLSEFGADLSGCVTAVGILNGTGLGAAVLITTGPAGFSAAELVACGVGAYAGIRGVRIVNAP